MKVLILGAGGHGQVVADILLAGQENSNPCATPIGFLDDDPALQGQTMLGLPIPGPISRLPAIQHDGVIVAVGSNQIRADLCRALMAQNERLVSAIHPKSVIGSEVSIGAGTVINAGAIVNTGAHLGCGVILNTGCTADHHNRIGDYVHIGPGAHLGGDVEIETGTLVGIGATIMSRCHVGPWSVIGAGAVVVRNIPANTTVVGVPARSIGETYQFPPTSPSISISTR